MQNFGNDPRIPVSLCLSVLPTQIVMFQATLSVPRRKGSCFFSHFSKRIAKRRSWFSSALACLSSSTMNCSTTSTCLSWAYMYVHYLQSHGNRTICFLFSLTNTQFGRSQWPRGLRRRSTAARLLRLWVRIPPEAWMFVCCECCVSSGKGLCDALITRPEESYQLWCIVCDLEA